MMTKRSIFVLLVCALGTCASTRIAPAGDRVVDQPFSRSLLESEQFDVKLPETGVDTSDGFHVRWIDREEPFEGTHVKTRFVLLGDLDITIRFRIGHLGTPDRGWGAGVLVRLDFADAVSSGVSVQRQVRPTGAQVLSLDLTEYGQARHDVKAIKIPPTEECSGIRLWRRDSTLRIAAIRENGDEELIWTEEVSPAAVMPLGFHVHSGGAVADLDVALTRFDIEADEIISREEFLHRSGFGKRFVATICSALLVVGVAKRALTRDGESDGN